ncbi:hypothetical protein glysoja_021768 [Glycine soja]|nr:hypothetical protein glysoja_021768 [Glycine soja]
MFRCIPRIFILVWQVQTNWWISSIQVACIAYKRKCSILVLILVSLVLRPSLSCLRKISQINILCRRPPSQTTVSTHQHSSSSLRSLLTSPQSSAIFTIADDEYFIIPDDCNTTFKVAPPRALTVVPRKVAHSLSCVGEVKTALR